MKMSVLELQELRISDCRGMQEIVAKEGAARADIEFQSLKKLEISQCPQLKAFNLTNGNIQQPFFNENVAFPSLEKLEFKEVDNLKMLWQNQLSEDSFCKLKSLTIEACKNLWTIFPSIMFGRFSQLEAVIIRRCRSLKEIFEPRVLNFEEVTEWNTDLQGIISFHKLHKVFVDGCPSLKCLFPATIAKSVLELQELEISYCDGMQEIVAKEGTTRADLKFVFPCVTILTLSSLPELRNFYPGIHTSEWPLLKGLEVTHCNKAEIFGSQLDMGAQQPGLFMGEKADGCTLN